MPVTLDWRDIALRLALASLAGLLIGLDRGEHSRPAGLRTTLLLCLAACIAMIQANLLLGTAGHNPGSFVVFDIMRLPLGILSGVGFIGGGAILRRGNMVQGVTTAATLWFVTVIGLAFGGGQLGLGLAGLALGLFVLPGLKWVERHSRREQRAQLSLMLDAAGPGETELQELLRSRGFQASNWTITYLPARQRRRLGCELRWRERDGPRLPPPVLRELEARPGVLKLEWRL